MGKIFEKRLEGLNTHIHVWRKVVCYLIMPWCGLETHRIGVTDKLFLVKMGKNLESICMEGQSHIFTFDLIFLGQYSMPRCPGFSERYFIVLIKARILLMPSIFQSRGGCFKRFQINN